MPEFPKQESTIGEMPHFRKRKEDKKNEEKELYSERIPENESNNEQNGGGGSGGEEGDDGEKVNISLVNNHSVDETDNEVITTAEKDNKRMEQLNKPLKTVSFPVQERRISRRRLSPIEYEPDEISQKSNTNTLNGPETETKISENDTKNSENNKNIPDQEEQPALIATRLKELYPNHVETQGKNQNHSEILNSNGISHVNDNSGEVLESSSEMPLSSTSKSGPKSVLQSTDSSERSPILRSGSVPADKAESKLNTNLELPAHKPIIGSGNIAGTGNRAHVVKIVEDEKDKSKLVEKVRAKNV